MKKKKHFQNQRNCYKGALHYFEKEGHDIIALWKGVCFQMRRRRKSRCGENFRPVTSKPQLVHGSEVDSATIQQTLYFSGGGNFRCILFQRHVWSVCPQSTQLKTMQRTASVSSIIRAALSPKLEEKDNESTNERELRAFFFGQL